ncbi:hypothetical protein [uncultured Paludibaculum sp.]|uniref:hypothetical protein n=1 Tax=uncultured Paludibaculum sp. TaxID=1765020 RepID=UPI002AAB3744|nr:hypothetical protein [uncultured Paludibaculum sp.]
MSSIVAGRAEITRRQLIVAAGTLGAGCRTTPSGPRATIRFTRIPLADVNGSDKHDIIEGAVAGAHQGQQIVLYAKNGAWWLQPLLEAPFTRIQPNAKWRNATHLGSDYAALLVDPGYRPERSIQTLPAVGGLVAAVGVAKGASASPSPMLQFSGYEWRVRTAASNRGGRNNPYSAANAWTDARGALHLRINKRGERFECAEVALTRSLGYGTYSFSVRDLSKLAPDLTLEMFTWDYSGADQNSREMDVVIRRRSSAPIQSARFVVQPYQVASNLYEFHLQPGDFAHSFRWEAGQIEFATSSAGNRKRVVAQHKFTLGIPTPGVESARIALYLPNSASQHPAEGEVVVDRFEYTP